MAVGRPISLTPNVATKTLSSTATADQTSFTVTGGYRINELGVYRNGVRLVQGKDFTASDGSTVTLLSGATVDDIIDFVIFDSFNIADAINTVGNQTISGELTATKFLGDGSSLTGVGDTAYIDAASLTVSGISTFSNTVSLPDDKSITLGSDDDLEIHHAAGGNSYIKNNTLQLDIRGDITNLNSKNNSVTFLKANASGLMATTGISTIATAKVTDTTASTSTSTGALVVSGGVGIAGSLHVGENVSVGGTLTYEDVTNIDSVGVVTAQLGVNVSGGEITVGAAFSVGQAGVVTAAQLNVTNTSTFNDDVNFVGTTNGITSSFWDNSTNTLVFKDNSYAKFGDGLDLSIYHDSSNSYIADTGTGDLRLRGSKVVIQNSGGTASVVESDGTGVELYYSNSKKFHTTNDGTVTTGIATATSIDAAIGLWILGADGTDHYTFTGIGLTVTTNDPTLELQRGQTYIFRNQSGGHPFRIQSTVNGSAGTAYNHGVTNNDGGNGTDITFAVPYNAPNILYYQCTSHANMGGVLLIGQRSVPILAKSAGYGVTAVDAGKTIYTDSDVTFPSGEFDPGDAISVVNNSGSSITLTQGSGLTLYNAADASTGSLTLAQRGMATVLYTTSSIAYGSGAGVS